MTSKQLKKIKPVFEKVIHTKINNEKDYLAYFISDRMDKSFENYEIAQLRPILKEIGASLWIFSCEGGKSVMVAVEIEP